MSTAYWVLPDGSITDERPINKDERDEMACYSQDPHGRWGYTKDAYSGVQWNPELPKELQLILFLKGEG